MQPRHLGIKVILVKSFARIHETNLKKQGMLALTFANEADYDKVQEDDTIDIVDLNSFAPDKQLTIVLRHANGTSDTIKVNHTYNAGQIGWFKAGSALNLMAASLAVRKAPAKPAAKKSASGAAKTKAKSAATSPKKTANRKPVKKADKKKVVKKMAAEKVVKASKPAKKVTKKGKAKSSVKKSKKQAKRR